MGHPAAGQPVTPQQIMNAGYDFATSAFRMTGPAGGVSASPDAGYFRVSAFNGGYGYQNIVTSAQTLVKSGAGILGRIAINATLTSAVRGYDNIVSGGNVLFTIPAGTTATAIPTYEARFVSGLVVSTGAAADNITVMFN